MRLQIKKVMDTRGIKAVQLAEMLGKSKQYVSNIVNGKVGISLDMLDELAKALGVHTWELIEGAPIDLEPSELNISPSQKELEDENLRLRFILKSVTDDWYTIEGVIMRRHPDLKEFMRTPIERLNMRLLGKKPEGMTDEDFEKYQKMF